jgi:hypothetical protein
MKDQTVGKYKQDKQWVVWERLHDGTIYEHAPTDYWRAIDKVRAIKQIHRTYPR